MFTPHRSPNDLTEVNVTQPFIGENVTSRFGVSINRHIHAQGSKLSKYHEGQGHKKVEARECCTMKFSDIPENYREIPEKLFNPFDKTSSEKQGNPKPVLLFMTENQRQYEEDALITQLGARNVTYSHAQYLRRLETEKSRPWLVGEDQNLTALGKVEKLKIYIDQGGFHLSSWHNEWINPHRGGDQAQRSQKLMNVTLAFQNKLINSYFTLQSKLAFMVRF